MSIAFDTNSLDAAADLLINIARKKNIASTFILSAGQRKKYNLQNKNEVIEYLIDKVEQIYSETSKVIVAAIAGVPYYSIGVVFEHMPEEMHPAPTFRGAGNPKYLACFWHAL